jgi:hypothetical protein
MTEPAAERRRYWSLRHQFLALGPLLFVWTATASLLWASAAQDEVPTERLFLDPATLSGQPWYTGLLHEIGILGWAVAATAAAAGAWVAALTDRRGSVWFLGSGSVLTLILLGDEMTGFHSGIGPRLGFPKLMIIAGLLVVTAVWLLGNWRQIRRTRWLTLAVSLVALASSVALDYERRDTSLHVFFEDAPKLLGIVGWATYFVFATADITQSVVRSHEPAATA